MKDMVGPCGLEPQPSTVSIQKAMMTATDPRGRKWHGSTTKVWGCLASPWAARDPCWPLRTVADRGAPAGLWHKARHKIKARASIPANETPWRKNRDPCNDIAARAILGASRDAHVRREVHVCTMTGEGWSHRFWPRPKGPLGLTEKNFPAEEYFFACCFLGESNQ